MKPHLIRLPKVHQPQTQSTFWDITITVDCIRKRLVKLQANKHLAPTQSAWMSSGIAHILTSHYSYYSISQYKQNKFPKTGETPTYRPSIRKEVAQSPAITDLSPWPVKLLNLWRGFYTNIYWTMSQEIKPSPVISMASRTNDIQLLECLNDWTHNWAERAPGLALLTLS